MLTNSTFEYLDLLKKNNNRDWFTENKKRFDSEQKTTKTFFTQILTDLEKIDSIEKMQMHRIYRDIRFSKLKIPYKTHFGASLGMGKGNKISGYYLHIEPGKSFLAGGVYQPESSVLKEIRKEISMNSSEFKKILEQKDFRNNFRGLSVESKLKRVPNDFEKDDPMAEFLKLKNFIVTHPISDEQLFDKNAAQHFAKIFESIQPLNQFLEAPFL